MSSAFKIQLFPFWAVVWLAIISACSHQPNGQSIITKAIQNHGGKAYRNSRIAFRFRSVRYTVKRKDGSFCYTRTFPDSLGGITDSLTNDSFSRTIAGKKVSLTDDEVANYSNSLNSVIYFALLPYKLNDAAVHKKLLGKSEINGEPYYEIGVTFDQDGGGTDHQDRYVYWINRENYTMDYLAYRFHVNEGGTRFREAVNIRKVNGIRFADYNNYGGPDMQRPLENYDSLFVDGDLKKVSEINLKDIEVKLLETNK